MTDTATGHTSTVPTGSVALTDTVGGNTTSLNGGNAVTLDGTGKATLTGVTLGTAGVHVITAVYAGVNGSFLPSASNMSVIVTAQITPTITWAPGCDSRRHGTERRAERDGDEQRHYRGWHLRIHRHAARRRSDGGHRRDRFGGGQLHAEYNLHAG